jgi:uncharacterized protein DUF4229
VNRSTVRAFAIYTGSRLLVFVGVLAILIAVGLQGFGVLILALLISGVISVLLLRRQRAVFAVAVEESIARRRAAQAAAARDEDDVEEPHR